MAPPDATLPPSTTPSLPPSTTPSLPPSLARSRRVYQPESLDLLYRHYYKDFRYG